MLGPFTPPPNGAPPPPPVTNNSAALEILSRTGCKFCDVEIDTERYPRMADETHPVWWVIQVHAVEVQRNSGVALGALDEQEILSAGVRLSHLQCRLTFGDDTKDNHVYECDIGTGFTCSQRSYNVKVEILHPPDGGPSEEPTTRGPGLLLDTWVGASASVAVAPRGSPTLKNTQVVGLPPATPVIIPIPTGSKFVSYYQNGGVKADLFWSTAQGPGFPAPNVGDIFGTSFPADKLRVTIPEFAKSIVATVPGLVTRRGTFVFQLEI